MIYLPSAMFPTGEPQSHIMCHQALAKIKNKIKYDLLRINLEQNTLVISSTSFLSLVRMECLF